MDLHAHFRPEQSIGKLIAQASPRIDLLTITEKPDGIDRAILSYDCALEKLTEEGIYYYSLGERAVAVDTPHGLFYLVRGMEVPTTDNQSVVMVGNRERYQADYFSVPAAITEAKRTGAFPFLDHPLTIGGVPLLFFRYTTADELQQRREWFQAYKVAGEGCNAINTLWMWRSNLQARKVMKEEGVTALANTDIHYNWKDVGKARTSISKSAIGAPFTDEQLFSALSQSLSAEQRCNVQIEAGYTTAFTFFWSMGIPALGELASSLYQK